MSNKELALKLAEICANKDIEPVKFVRAYIESLKLLENNDKEIGNRNDLLEENNRLKDTLNEVKKLVKKDNNNFVLKNEISRVIGANYE